MKLTEAQRSLIVAMGFRSNALANGDEYRPMWWLEGGEAVKANVAKSLVRLGLVKFTKHEGGQPGVLFFTVTPAGRAALEQEGSRTNE